MIGIFSLYDSYGGCFVYIKHIVCKLRLFTMHKITMQVDFTIGKLNLLFHENAIFRPSLTGNSIVNITELNIFLCKLVTDAHIQIIFYYRKLYYSKIANNIWSLELLTFILVSYKIFQIHL